jgi:signal transduction histidine kinase
MLGRLEQAETRQHALVSDTAHELRSPLASIRTQLEVALDHPDRQHWPETAAGVLADTLRPARLADDLLVLARLDERGTRPPVREPVDLDALIQTARERYPAPRVPLDVRGGTPATVRGDAAGLTRMLDNLIDNATRHAATGVRVRLGRAGRGWRSPSPMTGPGSRSPTASGSSLVSPGSTRGAAGARAAPGSASPSSARPPALTEETST